MRALRGRQARLQAELARALREGPVPAGRIERLRAEIAATEQAIDGVESPADASAGAAVPISAPISAPVGAPIEAPVAHVPGLARPTPPPVRLARLTPFGRRAQAAAVG